jgi:DNA-binding NtrC family response regulator
MRKGGPFVALDCGEIAPAQLEGELFGRPAGERPARPGALELAHGGSLLLDEVSELPLSLQRRLEAVLTEGTLVLARNGQPQPLDVRLIAATRRKLANEVERERFLPDLLTRLSQSELALPPLRERREDIPLLAQHLLAQRDPHAGAPTPAISTAALGLLALHDWPGNVRELRNVLERGVAAAQRGPLELRGLAALLLGSEPPAASEHRPGDEPSGFEPGLSYREQRARFENAFEQRYVAWLLDRHDGNVSAAARAAEMDRKYLYKLARKHALKPAT